MTWHKGSSPHDHWPTGLRQYSDSAPRVIEETLAQEELVVERKKFTLALRENPRGRFLRIIEGSGTGKYSKIIIPSTGLEEFRRLVAEMIEADQRKKPARMD